VPKTVRLVIAAGAAAAVVLLSLMGFPRSHDGDDRSEVSFQDGTAAAGLDVYSPTFGAVAADIDNDGIDDLAVSNHNQPPSLFLNRNGLFIDSSDIFPDRVRSDWHGITAVDLDNDGDRDLIIAAGGSDGTGPGLPNRLFRSLLADTGQLAFENIAGQADLNYRAWRSRVFLPIAGPDGSKVDLYMVGLAREGCPNLYFSNESGPDIVLKPDPSLGLNQTIGSEGLDLVFDADRDGDSDLIILQQFRPIFYERRADGYHRDESKLQVPGGYHHAAAGDLDNDGYPDLFLAHYPPDVVSDNVSFTRREIHFVVNRHSGDASDEVQFGTPAEAVDFDLSQHTPFNPVTGVADIFIGSSGQHPSSRTFTQAAGAAAGRPVLDAPGTYIWNDAPDGRWHIVWKYGSNPGPFKGRIMASSLIQVEAVGFEALPPAPAEDIILINQKGQGFKRLETISVTHFSRTRTAVMADINNDGLLDIVGIRGSEQGRYNGEPFALINRGGLNFSQQSVMSNREDDIFQADMLVCGFFNPDGLPDFFFTNGNGLNPDHAGPFKLFLNTTRNANDSVILRLRGRAANRDAIGAQVELYDLDGTLLGWRQVGAGYCRAQSTRLVHFGLGLSSSPTMAVRIFWPGAPDWDNRLVLKNRTTDIVQ